MIIDFRGPEPATGTGTLEEEEKRQDREACHMLSKGVRLTQFPLGVPG